MHALPWLGGGKNNNFRICDNNLSIILFFNGDQHILNIINIKTASDNKT